MKLNLANPIVFFDLETISPKKRLLFMAFTMKM